MTDKQKLSLLLALSLVQRFIIDGQLDTAASMLADVLLKLTAMRR